MKGFISAGAVVVTTLVAGCGGELSEMKQALDNVQSIASSAEEAQKSMDRVQKRIEERRTAGDTIPMGYEDLQKKLHDVSGWTSESPSGETVTLPGMTFSTATRDYSKGNSRMTVSIHDYSGSPAGYTGSTMVFGLAMKIDNSTQRTETFQTSNDLVNGMMEFYKNDKRGTITWAIAGRFVLRVEATGVDSIDEVRAFGEQFGIEGLAAM
jgi:hypothetical protein